MKINHFRFKGEIYPLIVLENSIAEGQKMTALMSSSGRISYSAPFFLRFRQSAFIDGGSIESKDRVIGQLKAFSKNMTMTLESHREDFKTATRSLLKRQGFLYEEDLFAEVFVGKKREEMLPARFAVHKYLFEGMEWIKDGQWSLNSSINSVGPYTLRPQWQEELINEAEGIDMNEIELFRDKMRKALKNTEPFRIESRTETILLKVLRVYADEFYVNAMSLQNPFKSILTEVLLGVAIVDSQSQAKELLAKLQVKEDSFNSRPLNNSHVQNNNNLNFQANQFNVKIVEEDCKLEVVDFGTMPVYLIDPLGTVEVDDGISVEFPNTVHVHVADPSEHVSGSLEAEAKRRAETIYLPELKIPMLPDRITQLSTLKSSGTRTITFSCKIDLKTGDLSEPKMRRGIINNLKHFTYEEAEGLSDKNPDISLINELSSLHLNYRKARGHFDFDFPRGIAKLDRETFKISVDVDADKLKVKKSVAEMMIIAGRIAGEFLRERKLSGPFRNQEAAMNWGDFGDSSRLSLLEKYKILKEMPLASVSSDPKRHSSMGLDAYVKVTSPLRRYLDLVTHKILKNQQSCYDAEWFRANLPLIRRQEIYNKRFGMEVNRYWIERFIWQQQAEEQGNEYSWTLTPLEEIKNGVWTVHIDQVANNFVAQIKNECGDLLGTEVKGRLVSKPWESLLKFEIQ